MHLFDAHSSQKCAKYELLLDAYNIREEKLCLLQFPPLTTYVPLPHTVLLCQCLAQKSLAKFCLSTCLYISSHTDLIFAPRVWARFTLPLGPHQHDPYIFGT